MEINRLEQSLKTALDELSLINGRIFVLNSFITQSKDRIENEPLIGHQLMESALGLRNITILDDVPNLYLSANHYKLTRDNLKEEVDMILSRECLFQIAQSCEMLETYLYNQVSELINQNDGLKLFVNYKTNVSTFASIRKALKGLSDRKNNRHLLAILRANCQTYQDYEIANLYSLDFRLWYEMLSEIRHSITHLRTEVSNEINALPSSSYTQYFNIMEYDGKRVVSTTFQQCSLLLSRIGEFIFFVFKAVSERCYGGKFEFESIQHFMPDIYTNLIQSSRERHNTD